MQSVTEVKEEFAANLNAAFSWLLIWWSGSLVIVAICSSLIPFEVLQNNFILTLSELTPAINVWANAYQKVPIIMVCWIYITLTSPMAIAYMIYKCRPTLILRIRMNSKKPIFSICFMFLFYIYIVVPVFLFGEMFGSELFSDYAESGRLTLGTRMILGSLLGGIFGSWLVGVAFCSSTVILVLSLFRLTIPVINGVTHGSRRQ